jgi:hypothetical protein
MYSTRELSEEIRQIIEEGLDSGRVQPASWIVDAVLKLHPFPPDWIGDDREFAEQCCQAHIRVEVRKKLREYKAAEEKDDPVQARLPGFDYVQRAYLVERGGEAVIVPIGQMTLDELQEKIAELEGMAQGCVAHAEELRRYCNERAGMAEAAE